MPIRYGRENTAGPLRELQGMHRAIAAQTFFPDETRSGCFREGWKEGERSEQAAEEVKSLAPLRGPSSSTFGALGTLQAGSTASAAD